MTRARPRPTHSLELDWLAGGWHSGDDAEVRLLWSRPNSHGITGILLNGRQTTLLSLDSSGHPLARSGEGSGNFMVLPGKRPDEPNGEAKWVAQTV